MAHRILITGGSGGFGKATARLFADRGERVWITGRDQARLESAADEIGAEGWIRADAGSCEDWQRVHERLMTEMDGLDLLVNNAGGGVNLVPFAEMSVEDIEASIRINLLGTMYGCRVFAPDLIRQGGGTIINVSSVCARHGWPTYTAYSAAKAGVLEFSKALYAELRPHGIRVTTLIPAAGATNFSVNANEVPSHHELQAEDVAQAIADVFYLPRHVVIEDMTVWGIDQEILPF